jgi:hypothetical protein
MEIGLIPGRFIKTSLVPVFDQVIPRRHYAGPKKQSRVGRNPFPNPSAKDRGENNQGKNPTPSVFFYSFNFKQHWATSNGLIFLFLKKIIRPSNRPGDNVLLAGREFRPQKETRP